jgi:hypothetical protein
MGRRFALRVRGSDALSTASPCRSSLCGPGIPPGYYPSSRENRQNNL